MQDEHDHREQHRHDPADERAEENLGALVTGEPGLFVFEQDVFVHPAGPRSFRYFLLNAGTAPARPMILPAALLVRTQSKNFSTCTLGCEVGSTPQS